VSAATITSRIPHRIRLNLKAVAGRAYPRIVGANREPSWIFFEAILPLLGIAAYVFIYQALANRVLLDPTVSAADKAATIVATNALIGSVVLGGTMIAFWLNVLWSMASQLYWEKEIGNLQLYMMAPMSRMALLGGMAVGGMFMTSVRAITTLVAGVVVFSIVLQVTNLFLLLAVFFATLVALYGMGMTLASLYLLWGREAWHLSALLEEPIFFTSGFYFPAGGLAYVGGWGRLLLTMATAIPATLGLDAMRQLVFPGAWGDKLWIFSPEVELVVILVLAVVFLVLARYALAYLEILARREGRLTSRHQ
jgi:ABC-2 type transport system permease protein